MIFDALPYSEYLQRIGKTGKNEAIRSFIELIERKLGIVAIYPIGLIPFGHPGLSDPYAIGVKLQEQGLLTSFERVRTFPDEPSIRLWNAVINDPWKNTSGGISSQSDKEALIACLAEGLERYLLNTQLDYLRSTHHETTRGIARFGTFIAPERFAGFSKEQRTKDASLDLNVDSKFLWTQAESLTNNQSVYLPVQTVAIAHNPSQENTRETLIRGQSTIGLATWPTREGARLAGALEVIEHDSYMIMWLNQMTLPRIQLDGPRNQSNTLDRLIKKCERYRLQVHAVRLLTDAPTHAVCVVVEDSTNLAIRFTLGLKAHRSLSHAIEKALLEALRARTVSRIFSDSTHKNGPSSPSKGRLERVAYWSNIEHSGALSFIIAGSEEDSGTSTWDFDNEEQHLGRIVDWCRQSSYECAAVSLGRSAQNPTNLHVEMVIIPELQPTHQSESKPHLGGTRLQKIPIQFGYSPRKNPFIERPHPFF